MPTLPVSRMTGASVQQIHLWPWNAATGPYDMTTEFSLAGLQDFTATDTITSAEGFGGDSTYQQVDVEVRRETEVKFSGFDFTFYLFSMLFGGLLSTSPAVAGEGEVVSWAPGYLDRAPFVRIQGVSNISSGTISFVYPKCKITGGNSYSMKLDGIHMPEFTVKALFDSTYTTHAGVVGAPKDWWYGDGSQTTPHS